MTYNPYTPFTLSSAEDSPHYYLTQFALASQQSLVVAVSIDNAVSIMKTKQPIRIVLFFPSQNKHNFYSVPVLVGNGIAVAAVTQLFDKMAEGGITNKRFQDKPHSPLSCFAMRLKPGQEIRECLLSYVKENNLKAPFVLSCVGSVTSATLRLANVSKDTPNEVS